MPNGESLGTSPYETDSDFDSIPDNEEFNYVHSFLTPDVTLSEYINAIKANSFPGESDSDGDYDPDSVDPQPYQYQLNNNFIHQSEKLENLAAQYNDGTWDVTSKYEVDKKYWLAMMFIRNFNDDYTGDNWPVVGGEIDNSFVDYVRSNDYELYLYFSNLDYIYANEYGELVDIKHFAATFTVYAYKTGLTDAKYFDYGKWYDVIENVAKSMMFEYNFDNLGGWAGDLQTLMIDAYDELNGDNDYNNFYDKIYSMIGSSAFSFSMPDMYADTDSYNIFVLLKTNRSNSLGEAFESYYSSGYKRRYSSFTNNWSDFTIQNLVETYTNTTYWVDVDLLRWPLFTRYTKDGTPIKYTFSEEQSQASADAFVNYLIEHINQE